MDEVKVCIVNASISVEYNVSVLLFYYQDEHETQATETVNQNEYNYEVNFLSKTLSYYLDSVDP